MAWLTKSKYLLGKQCPKLLWVAVNKPELLPEIDEVTQKRFDEGHAIGELAKKIFPDGINIQEDDFKANIHMTTMLLKQRKPLFEAGFLIDNLYSRADILVPVNGDEWDIIEVKSSTRVKDVHIWDLAFQKFVYQKCGLKIRKCFLMHVNNKYVRQGDIDSEKFFSKEDVGLKVRAEMRGIADRVEKMLRIIKLEDYPSVKIGPQCTSPYTCGVEECWKHIGKENVFQLMRGGQKSWELYDKGIIYLKDIEDIKLSNKQKIQVKCSKENEIYIEKNRIKSFLDKFEKPIYYMDFETINPAIPLYDSMRPYQRVPFQFSVHIDDGNKIEHKGFLGDGKTDPRKEFISELKKVLGDKGSIIVYNASFEKGVLVELCKEFPEYSEWVKDVHSRIIDLYNVFKNMWYYDPKQNGSASIKYVLPALTGKDYSNMEIGNGAEAILGYLELAKKPELRDALWKYCEMDTIAMKWIVDRLREVVE